MLVKDQPVWHPFHISEAPPPITISAGDSVLWTADKVFHICQVFSKRDGRYKTFPSRFESSKHASGFTQLFDEAGVFWYTVRYHGDTESCVGCVIVKPSVRVHACILEGSSITPTSMKVNAGDVVFWTKQGELLWCTSVYCSVLQMER